LSDAKAKEPNIAKTLFQLSSAKAQLKKEISASDLFEDIDDDEFRTKFNLKKNEPAISTQTTPNASVPLAYSAEIFSKNGAEDKEILVPEVSSGVVSFEMYSGDSFSVMLADEVKLSEGGSAGLFEEIDVFGSGAGGVVDIEEEEEEKKDSPVVGDTQSAAKNDVGVFGDDYNPFE
jgi:hypothetical protein